MMVKQVRWFLQRMWLSDAIIALLKDDAKRENMADNIRNDYFVGDKSWKVIAEKYIGFYKSLRENFSINK